MPAHPLLHSRTADLRKGHARGHLRRIATGLPPGRLIRTGRCAAPAMRAQETAATQCKRMSCNGIRRRRPSLPKPETRPGRRSAVVRPAIVVPAAPPYFPSVRGVPCTGLQGNCCFNASIVPMRIALYRSGALPDGVPSLPSARGPLRIGTGVCRCFAAIAPGRFAAATHRRRGGAGRLARVRDASLTRASAPAVGGADAAKRTK